MVHLPIQIARSRQVKTVAGVFVWLCSINAVFWILARGVGAFLDVFSELFWEDVWSVLAVLYNIALAVLFSAVLFVSATGGAAPKDALWREMCGFVMLYLALGAAYMDKTRGIGEEARPGYALGLVAYLVFAAFPRLVAFPQLGALIKVMAALSRGWLGWALTVFMVAGVVREAVRKGLRGMFYYLSPFLWFIGVLKHPPIRVRRRD